MCIRDRYRENIKTKIIAITGSCGKTTLKELLGSSLNQLSKVGISPKSYNNLSLIHISEPTRQAEISYAVFCLKKN